MDLRVRVAIAVLGAFVMPAAVTLGVDAGPTTQDGSRQLQPKIGTADDLGTDSFGMECTLAPSIADSPSKKLYIVWPAISQKAATKIADVPLIPDELTFSPGSQEANEVPGISLWRQGRWSKPQLLVESARQCTPIFAWCVDEDLNMLITDGAWTVCRHIRLEAASRQWKQVAVLPVVPYQYSAFRVVGKDLHIACNDNGGVHYLTFVDGTWTQPLSVKDSARALRTRLATDGRGHTFLAWSTPGDGRLSFCRMIGSEVRQLPGFSDQEVKSEAFDIAVNGNGALLVAYQESLGDLSKYGAVYVRTLSDDGWSEPTSPNGRKPCLGGIKALNTARGRVFISWLQRANVSSRSASYSGPACSFVVSKEDGWTEPQLAARYKQIGWLHGPYMGHFFAGCHLDGQGIVHMAWGGPAFYHAAIVDLNSPAQTGGPPL